MPWSATTLGLLLGFGIQAYSNGLRKLPLMRHPWEHVMMMGLGVVFTHQYVKFDEKAGKEYLEIFEKAKQANERRYIDAEDD